jgi:DNA polymerase-3 subunit gamma/tau
MSYQVLARKWRPQRFDEVVGQQPVTRTLRNAIASGRVAHAFVFAGPRGCGKTTTARILARALNCVKGPAPEPCGVCDACVEIAQGRDIDVLEIDAASHTGIDNIREVVIAGLAIAPVRDRYKIFIIDEVHQLSTPSFNALLKSIEEPPAHVVFMMATTELHRIPDTILSRSQVFEFRAISARAIAEQLRKIADTEQIEASDEALALLARSAEGSMRDAQSALDQVIAFAGGRVTVDEVSAVLGLVGRDLLFDLVESVIAEDGPRAFVLADRAIEGGYDLKLVCRELARLMRDMMLLSVDPARAGDGELAAAELERLRELGTRFSREDLMRAFDLLGETEQEIRTSSHPRYHFEMALLRWMHLRKLVPLTELMEQLKSGRPAPPPPGAVTPARPAVATPKPTRETKPATGVPSHPRTVAPSHSGTVAPSHPRTVAPLNAPLNAPSNASLKDAFLGEIRAGKTFFYNTVVAQAQRIDVAEDTITFTFLPHHRALREQFDQARAWLESTAQRLAGRRIAVNAVQAAASQDVSAPSSGPIDTPPPAEARRDLKAEAMSSSAVQAMLDVFPAEIRDVEEM